MEIWESRVESLNGGWRGDCHCLTVDEGGRGRIRGLRRERSSCPHRQFVESRSRSKTCQPTSVLWFKDMVGHMDAID